jgi:hypothetical protein
MASFVRFHRAFTFSPPGARWARGYAEGWTILVPETHASAAEAAGAGERVPRAEVNRSDPRVSNGRHFRL